LFISFEGGEGSGKTTQAKALKRRLSRKGLPAILTHEPGGTALGQRVRWWLKWGEEISPEVELLLFEVSRAQLVAKVICPAIAKGTVVICDRFSDSTLAYQGYGRGSDLGVLQAVNSVATRSLKPDLIVLLDIEVGGGLDRKRSMALDRFEREKLDFHQRVREGYLKMAAADPDRWLVVDAALPKKEIQKLIWQRVESMLKANHS
jgi:dTMP kinase